MYQRYTNCNFENNDHELLSKPNLHSLHGRLICYFIFSTNIDLPKTILWILKRKFLNILLNVLNHSHQDHVPSFLISYLFYKRMGCISMFIRVTVYNIKKTNKLHRHGEGDLTWTYHSEVGSYVKITVIQCFTVM